MQEKKPEIVLRVDDEGISQSQLESIKKFSKASGITLHYIIGACGEFISSYLALVERMEKKGLPEQLLLSVIGHDPRKMRESREMLLEHVRAQEEKRRQVVALRDKLDGPLEGFFCPPKKGPKGRNTRYTQKITKPLIVTRSLWLQNQGKKRQRKNA